MADVCQLSIFDRTLSILVITIVDNLMTKNWEWLELTGPEVHPFFLSKLTEIKQKLVD